MAEQKNIAITTTTTIDDDGVWQTTTTLMHPVMIWIATLTIVYYIVRFVLLADLPPLRPEHKLAKDHYKKKSINFIPKRFLLTGCASGVGKHLTGVLLGLGHSVIATDVNSKALQEITWNGPGKLVRVKLDVTKREDWEAAVVVAKEEFGALDVVMNIAGYLYPGKVQDDSTLRYIDLHLGVNVAGVMNGTCIMSRFMIESIKQGELINGGHIINIASMAAKAPIDGLTLYSASKYACRGFSLCAAKDLYSEGIYVTVVCPDAIKTPMLDMQATHDSAVLSFCGEKALTVEDVERLIMDKVLIDRPREVMLTDFVRSKLIYLGDMFSNSRLVAYLESAEKAKGRLGQKIYIK
jgi:3-oxoacyl-[acyl-carrier protein] reductase